MALLLILCTAAMLSWNSEYHTNVWQDGDFTVSKIISYKLSTKRYAK